jgi:hypothetical protein
MNILVLSAPPQIAVKPSGKPLIKVFVAGTVLGIFGTLVALDQLEKRKIHKGLNNG